MTTIQIPLDRNADVAALLADKQPGDKVYACFSLKSMDPQTATLRIEEFADTADELSKPDDAAEEDGETDDSAEEEKAETDQSPEGKEAEPYTGKKPGSMGREMAAKLMSGGDSSF